MALSCGFQKRPWAAEAASPPALFYLDRNTTRSGANGSIRATYRSGSAAGGADAPFCLFFSFFAGFFSFFLQADESPRDAVDEEEEEERCLLFIRQY